MRFRRLGLITGLAFGTLAAPAFSYAQQQAKVQRIGFLGLSTWGAPYYEAFWQAMRELGYVDHKTIAGERRDAGGDASLLDDHAADLVRLKVDVIVADSTPAALAAKKATRTIPIVAIADDPVADGLVATFARPGANITGLASLVPELTAKRVELLKEVAPRVSRVAVVWDSAGLGANLKEAQTAAQALGVRLLPLQVRHPGEIERAFAAVTRGRADALILTTVWDPYGHPTGRRILEFAAKNRMPAMYAWRGFVDAGGLISYGASLTYLSRGAAIYVDKILKGATPADLPVEQPMRFELVINLKTAKVLGLRIPQSVLVRADEVIQ